MKNKFEILQKMFGQFCNIAYLCNANANEWAAKIRKKSEVAKTKGKNELLNLEKKKNGKQKGSNSKSEE